MGDGLVGVIVGGLIAILSGVAAPMVQHFLGKKSRDEEAKKANIQTLIIAIHELDDWLQAYRDKTVSGKDVILGVSPQSMIEALILVHFPQAKIELRELFSAIAEHNAWATARQSERVANEKIDVSEFSDISRTLAVRRSNVIAAITDDHRFEYNSETKEIEAVKR